MKKYNLLFLSLFMTLVLTPLILAQWGGWGGGTSYGYFSSPLYFLENEWVMFSLVFLVFFAIIFYTMNKSFKNAPVSGVVALALSLFISMTIAQRNLLSGFGGSNVIGAWSLVIAVLIAFGFLLKFSYESFGRIGAIASVIILWSVLHGVNDPYAILPYEISNIGIIMDIYIFMTSWLGLLVLIIISAVIISARVTRRGLNAGMMSDSLFGR